MIGAGSDSAHMSQPPDGLSARHDRTGIPDFPVNARHRAPGRHAANYPTTSLALMR